MVFEKAPFVKTVANGGCTDDLGLPLQVLIFGLLSK
jgi:hypothetical protein